MRGLYSETIGQHIAATDGYLGRLTDALLDDRFWGTNYFVIDTTHTLPHEQVLMSIESVMPINPHTEWIAIKHSIEQVRQAPHLEKGVPVSQQYERQLMAHYNWSVPPFLYARTPLVTPDGVVTDSQTVWSLINHFDTDDHLLSANDLGAYKIDSLGQQVGELADIVFDMDNWRISILVANIRETDSSSVSRQVPVSPAWIRRISREEKQICIDLPLEALLSSPTFSKEWLNTHYMDKQLFEHYRDVLNERV